MPTTIPRLLLTLGVFCLLLAAPQAMAEKKPAVGTAPPQPIEMNLKVRRDAKTEISLRIVGKAGEPLKYLVRVPPEHGRLSAPRPTEREVSVVTYQPPADLAITADKFSYAVQNSIGVSGAVDVNITIVDEQPRLSFPDALDFSKIRAGSTDYRLLEISNQGGLIATGEVRVDPPWRVEGRNGYLLKAGDVAVFKLVFEPTEGGSFEGVARFTSEPEHSTTLRGAAEAVIAPNPARWVLNQTPGDTVRGGTFELTSNLDEERTLRFQADPRLKIKPMEVVLPARGTVKIAVEASSSEVQAFDTNIHLDAPPDFSIPVPVHVPTLAATVRLTSPAVDFGRVLSGPDASAVFELENTGGMPAAVTWDVSPPFKVKDKSATLRPGEKKTFSMAVETKIPNRYRTWLHFKAGTQAFDVPVEAEIVTSGKTGPSTQPSLLNAFKAKSGNEPEFSPSSLPSSEEAKTALLAVRDNLPPDLLPTAPPPKGVRIEKIKPTSAVLAWPASLSPASQYKVEVRMLGTAPDHKTLVIQWQQIDTATVESQPPNYATTLKDLAPGQPWTFRVRPVLGPGKVGDPLFTVSFATPTPPSLLPHVNSSTLAELLVVGLLLLVGWQAWERTRPRSIL